MDSFEQRHDVTLDPGQRAMVLGFTNDPHRLVVGIGPAGAGKTTAMKAVAEAWRIMGRRVIPLAPSATAAEVLGSELGCRAENLHKFRHAHDASPTGRPDDPWFVLEPGDLVLFDEADMSGTRNLGWLTHYARGRGATDGWQPAQPRHLCGGVPRGSPRLAGELWIRISWRARSRFTTERH